MFESFLYILGRMHGLTVQEIRQVKSEKMSDWGTAPVTLEGWAVVEDDIREFARRRWEDEGPFYPVGEVPPIIEPAPLPSP